MLRPDFCGPESAPASGAAVSVPRSALLGNDFDATPKPACEAQARPGPSKLQAWSAFCALLNTDAPTEAVEESLRSALRNTVYTSN
jgi:hypothetical protein